ncbi:progranulin [Caerostris extrusa]|uniref:Progranulin n=1 Tax=Caerostris extrusa TaxID=172846 RepID=A0AAV4XL93_CAEEX|nr:progranulin [Caerostris extrusa]
MKSGIILMFIPLIIALKKECPGGTFQCPDSATCCQLINKSYGCCPLENAVCCDDHIHCCPANTKCAPSMCVQSNNKTLDIHKLINNDVICDDKSVCPVDTTCCQNPNTGKFGCCPMESAVCCNDGLHCCPEGTTCNLEKKKCDGDGFTTLMYDSHKKIHVSSPSSSLLQSKKESSVICPGSQFQCPDGYTCCKLPNGDYGCCPFIKATCCKDGLHCCPEHMHCDETSQYCSQGPRNITSVHQKTAVKISAQNVCPDHSSCEGYQTCCKMSDSTYGCCAYANATCCSDFQSCCPSHEVCDVQNRRCIPKQILLNNFVSKYSVQNV